MNYLLIVTLKEIFLHLSHFLSNSAHKYLSSWFICTCLIQHDVISIHSLSLSLSIYIYMYIYISFSIYFNSSLSLFRSISSFFFKSVCSLFCTIQTPYFIKSVITTSYKYSSCKGSRNQFAFGVMSEGLSLTEGYNLKDLIFTFFCLYAFFVKRKKELTMIITTLLIIERK